MVWTVSRPSHHRVHHGPDPGVSGQELWRHPHHLGPPVSVASRAIPIALWPDQAVDTYQHLLQTARVRGDRVHHGRQHVAIAGLRSDRRAKPHPSIIQCRCLPGHVSVTSHPTLRKYYHRFAYVLLYRRRASFGPDGWEFKVVRLATRAFAATVALLAAGSPATASAGSN